MNRRGFSLIELLITLTILGILANLTVPAVAHMRRRAQAVHVVADFVAVRVAAFDRYAADGRFPPSDSWARVPLRLAGSLPRGFAFRYGDVDYRWRVWRDRDCDDDDDGCDEGRRSNQALAGLEIRGRDRKLMQAIRAAYRGPIIANSSRQFTFIVSR